MDRAVTGRDRLPRVVSSTVTDHPGPSRLCPTRCSMVTAGSLSKTPVAFISIDAELLP
ncbi:MAG: hypothetical protein PPP55_07855 [Halorubrum sp.]